MITFFSETTNDIGKIFILFFCLALIAAVFTKKEQVSDLLLFAF